MAEVSHSGRRKRPWTAQEQIISEVAIACRCTLKEISSVLSRPPATINKHVKCGALAAHAETCRKYREQNRDKVRETCKRYRETYPERVKDSQLRFHAANPGANMRYYYAKHEERKARSRESYRRNIQKRKQYREQNKEKRAEQMRKWYINNKDKVRQYLEKNAEKIRAYRKARYHMHPERMREKALRYNYKKRASRKISLIAQACEQKRVRDHVLSLFLNKCSYCGAGGAMEIDHVVPLSKGGLDELGNLTTACKKCNTSKRDREVEAWYRAQPFFSETRWRKIQQHCPAAVTGQLSIPIGA